MSSEKRLVSQWPISMDLIDLVANFEGFKATAYKCLAGHWTIGYGHTGGVSEGDTIAQAAAKRLLRNDLAKVRTSLSVLVHVPVTKNQFGALVSLSYNVGNLRTKCPKLLAALNSGKIEDAAKEFLDCDHVGGRRVAGLTRRRKIESELFLKDA